MAGKLRDFATTQDIELLWRELSPEEETRAEALLSVVSDTIRHEAYKVNQDLDLKIEESPVFENVVRSVTVDIVSRTLLTSTEDEPLTQESQSALGYSWSGSYLVPGGGLFIKKSELSRLGLRRQRYGAIDLYG